MKMIINNEIYDTDTAEKICGYTFGKGTLGYISETLYRKKTGEFFRYGEGGPLSAYGELGEEGSMCGSSDIFPFPEEYAKDFVERFGSVEIYEELFGEVEE